MTHRRILLTLPIALSVVAVAVAQKSARADAGTDAAVADAGADAGDAGRDDESTGCGASAPPNGMTALGAGCC
jgi:hypothetical protein